MSIQSLNINISSVSIVTDMVTPLCSLLLRVAAVVAAALGLLRLYNYICNIPSTQQVAPEPDLRIQREQLCRRITSGIEAFQLDISESQQVAPGHDLRNQKEQLCRRITSRIEALQLNISGSQKKEILEQVLRIINHDVTCPYWIIHNILLQIELVPINQLKAFVDQAERLMYREMHSMERMTIVQGLKIGLDFSKQGGLEQTDLIKQMEIFVNQSYSLISWNMGAFERRQIMITLGRISSNRRQQIVEEVQHQIREEPALNGNQIAQRICNKANIPPPRDLPEELLRNTRGRLGVDVHSRDALTRSAWEIFCRYQGECSDEQLKENVAKCLTYFRTDTSNVRQKALQALAGPKPEGSSFDPLLEDEREGGKWSLAGLEMRGLHVVGRLWGFIQSLHDGIDKENALNEMQKALNDCFDDQGGLICNQGKIQRLIVALVQGRVSGIEVDRPENMVITPAQALSLFMQSPEIRSIETRTALLAAAELYLRENPRVNQNEFLDQVHEYARQSELPSGLQDE